MCRGSKVYHLTRFCLLTVTAAIDLKFLKIHVLKVFMFQCKHFFVHVFNSSVIDTYVNKYILTYFSLHAKPSHDLITNCQFPIMK